MNVFVLSKAVAIAREQYAAWVVRRAGYDGNVVAGGDPPLAVPDGACGGRIPFGRKVVRKEQNTHGYTRSNGHTVTTRLGTFG